MSNSFDNMDCRSLGSSVHGILQARLLEWVAITFSRGIFLTQESTPSILHCRQILYWLSYKRSPFNSLKVYISRSGSAKSFSSMLNFLRNHQTLSYKWSHHFIFLPTEYNGSVSPHLTNSCYFLFCFVFLRVTIAISGSAISLWCWFAFP